MHKPVQVKMIGGVDINAVIKLRPCSLTLYAGLDIAEVALSNHSVLLASALRFFRKCNQILIWMTRVIQPVVAADELSSWYLISFLSKPN